MPTKGSVLLPRRKKPSAADSTPKGGVRVSNLVKSFGDNRVLDDVSFEIPEGSVCTLLGASGSGKTTTLRQLAGLDAPDEGEIWIGGEPMVTGTKVVPAENRDVGLVFQSYALWPHMRVFDQIAYPLRVRKLSRTELETAVHDTAKIVGLVHLLDRFPSQLSGGQQQRVALARALVFGPRLLLLDEPLSNLDAALRRQTRLELQQLQERVKVTTIYVTHDQQEAMAVSDIVVVMAGGKVVTIDTPRAIYDRPTTEFVASFVGSSNMLRGTVRDVKGEDAWVTLADGTVIQGNTPHDLSAGETALLTVKPVDIVLGATPGQPNTISADVMSSTYLGDQLELILRVKSEEVRVSLPRSERAEPGDNVTIHVPKERVTVLRPDPS